MKFGTFCWACLVVTLGAPLLSARGADLGTIRGENTLIRSQPTRFSPVMTKLQPGDVVAVLEQITLEKPAPKDEVLWLKIACPTNATVWVSRLYVDTNLNTVLPARLNVRAGPSEFYPIVGLLKRGETITSLGRQGNWIEIVPPSNTWAYVAATLVNVSEKTEAEITASPTNATPAVTEATNVIAEVTNTTAEVTNVMEVASVSNAPTAVLPAEPVPEPAASTPMTNEASNSVSAIPPEEPAPEIAAVPAPEPPKPRIVTREGIISGITSIQAPSYFKLENLENERTMDFLYTTSTNLQLRRYIGLHVIVTGEESLDERWPTIPVITIHRIQVVTE